MVKERELPPTVTETGKRAKESLPLILSIFSAEQEAGASVKRKDGGEGNDGRYMKGKDMYSGIILDSEKMND